MEPRSEAKLTYLRAHELDHHERDQGGMKARKEGSHREKNDHSHNNFKVVNCDTERKWTTFERPVGSMHLL